MTITQHRVKNITVENTILTVEETGKSFYTKNIIIEDSDGNKNVVELYMPEYIAISETPIEDKDGNIV